MTNNGNARKKLAKEAGIILTKRGAEAYKKAKEIVLNEKIKCKTVREAIRYFMQEWRDVKHPGLLVIACEAVGGDPDSVNDIGAALLLLLGSAHIHDDIIDQSKKKEHRLTVYGKFGQDIALLVGDTLLFEGLVLLHQFCEKFPEHKRRTIIGLTKTAFFEIGSGETEEIILRKKDSLLPKECLGYLKMRAAMAEAVMRIGAIMGGGNEKEIEILGHYGRTLGLLSAIREEFIDIFEPEELKERYTHEFLPLPILYALQNVQKRKEIIRIFQKKKILEKDAYALIDLVMDTKEVQKLEKKMRQLIDSELRSLSVIKRNKETLNLLLQSIMEDL
jgi:geranylgeranyl pyrophosphate synthase